MYRNRDYWNRPYTSDLNGVFGSLNDLFEVALKEVERNNNRALNLVEQPKQYFLEAAVPGAEREDFNIEVTTDKQLKVSYKPAKKNIHAKEFSYFWNVPEAEPEGVTATYVGGVLKISVPKVVTKEQKSHKVQVF